jgi:hypothetical protein
MSFTLGVLLGPPNTSAVYTVDSGTAGSMAGATIEERADAGTNPAGDQNVARALIDRSVLDSAVGGGFAIVGEGFLPAETVTLSVCAAGSVTADANGGAGFFLNAGPGAGVYSCTLTGGTSGFVAQGSVIADPKATNLRGLIVQPAFVAPGGTVTVLATKRPALDTGDIYLNGTLQGNATTDAKGKGEFTFLKPLTRLVHDVYGKHQQHGRLHRPSFF